MRSRRRVRASGRGLPRGNQGTVNTKQATRNRKKSIWLWSVLPPQYRWLLVATNLVQNLDSSGGLAAIAERDGLEAVGAGIPRAVLLKNESLGQHRVLLVSLGFRIRPTSVFSATACQKTRSTGYHDKCLHNGLTQSLFPIIWPQAPLYEKEGTVNNFLPPPSLFSLSPLRSSRSLKEKTHAAPVSAS